MLSVVLGKKNECPLLWSLVSVHERGGERHLFVMDDKGDKREQRARLRAAIRDRKQGRERGGGVPGVGGGGLSGAGGAAGMQDLLTKACGDDPELWRAATSLLKMSEGGDVRGMLGALSGAAAHAERGGGPSRVGKAKAGEGKAGAGAGAGAGTRGAEVGAEGEGGASSEEEEAPPPVADLRV